MNDKFYLPIANYPCYDYMGNGIIRAYPTRPTRPSSSSGGYYSYSYRDYYINDNYLFRTGSSNYYYNTTLPSCDLNGRITTDIFYRQDIGQVLVTFFILFIFIIYIPYKLFTKLFKRRSYI